MKHVRARFARQGIHIHRINAENIRQSPQEIHHVKPLRGFGSGGGACFSIDMIPPLGKYIYSPRTYHSIDMVSLTGNNVSLTLSELPTLTA
jgi:hypothetical protein